MHLAPIYQNFQEHALPHLPPGQALPIIVPLTITEEADVPDNANRKKTNPVQIVKYVKGIDFPADRTEIIEQAKKNGAAEDVVKVLSQIPNQQYEMAADLTKEAR